MLTALIVYLVPGFVIAFANLISYSKAKLRVKRGTASKSEHYTVNSLNSITLVSFTAGLLIVWPYYIYKYATAGNDEEGPGDNPQSNVPPEYR